MENNVICFPGVGTWRYNAERLHRYAGELMKKEKWPEFEITMMMQELHDEGLIEIDWDLESGEPIARIKDKNEKCND